MSVSSRAPSLFASSRAGEMKREKEEKNIYMYTHTHGEQQMSPCSAVCVPMLADKFRCVTSALGRYIYLSNPFRSCGREESLWYFYHNRIRLLRSYISKHEFVSSTSVTAGATKRRKKERQRERPSWRYLIDPCVQGKTRPCTHDLSSEMCECNRALPKTTEWHVR